MLIWHWIFDAKHQTLNTKHMMKSAFYDFINFQYSIKKRTPLGLWAGFTDWFQAGLSASSFWSFERIDLGRAGGFCWADMGCQIAVTVLPFDRRLRTCSAIPAGWEFGSTVATVTLLDDLMANPAVVWTPISGHKRALHTFFNGCTNHWNHPLNRAKFVKKKPGTN